MTPSPARFDRFLELPAELRCMVYQEYISDHQQNQKGIQVPDDSTNAAHGGITHPSFLPPLCLASGQLRFEATLEFINLSHWIIRSHQGNHFFNAFLHSVDPIKAYKAVKSVQYTNFGWFRGEIQTRINEHVEQMLTFPLLRHVTLGFPIKRMVDRDPAHLYQPKSIDDLADWYGLDYIFDNVKLESIEFVLINYPNKPRAMEDSAEDAMADLAWWFDDECVRMECNPPVAVSYKVFVVATGT